MNERQFRAGVAQVDVTPSLGTVINGEFTCRYANRIADQLHAKALYLQNGATQVLIVLVDICLMKKEFLDQVKQQIFERTGIAPGAQLLASTHTHSGGSVADLLMCHEDFMYKSWLPSRIVEAAVLAKAATKPARIAWGKVNKREHMRCRRYQMDESYQAENPVTGNLDQVKTNPFGSEHLVLGATTTPDPSLGYLAIQDVDGNWMGILANYCLHYVGDCERGTITADYFGYFTRALAENLGNPEGFVGIMSNGTSGEINIWNFEGEDIYPSAHHEKSKFIGSDLASAVCKNLSELVWEEEPDLDVLYQELDVNYRKPTSVELNRAKAIVQQTDYENITFGTPLFFEQVYAREQVLLSQYPDTHRFPIQSIKIGSGKIGGLGGEFFTETGISLKQELAGTPYFTICFANDYVGYVPPAAELERGGYETWRCRSSCLAKESESTIRETLLEQLKGVNQDA